MTDPAPNAHVTLNDDGTYTIRWEWQEGFISVFTGELTFIELKDGEEEAKEETE